MIKGRVNSVCNKYCNGKKLTWNERTDSKPVMRKWVFRNKSTNYWMREKTLQILCRDFTSMWWVLSVCFAFIVWGAIPRFIWGTICLNGLNPGFESRSATWRVKLTGHFLSGLCFNSCVLSHVPLSCYFVYCSLSSKVGAHIQCWSLSHWPSAISESSLNRSNI